MIYILHYRIYGFFHKTAKKILNKQIPGAGINFLYIYNHLQSVSLSESIKKANINGNIVYTCNNNTRYLFYGENSYSRSLEKIGSIPDYMNEAPKLTREFMTFSNTKSAWLSFLEASAVPAGWLNSGFLQGGYIKERKNWCLSSWIWTTAAVARYYANVGDKDKCLRISDAYINIQEDEGGWVVRNDYINGRTINVIAPNDSAYIATNAILNAYKLSNDVKYLNSACKCANWIIETSRDDGLTWISLDKLENEWKTDSNIVDIGFTAALFAELYKITKIEKYKIFCERFINIYIDLFWNEKEGLFFTAIDDHDKPFGGYFGRGQAWALEGLIPVYQVFRNERIKKIISKLITSLIERQNKSGGWSYNLDKPLMGEDCKGVPVIAYNLLKWELLVNDSSIRYSVQKAILWCKSHTEMSGESAGGIFSYSTEGSIVHDLYTETALVYSTAYVLEIDNMLNRF